MSFFIQNKLLVATNAMTDTRFDHAVIYIAEHNENGATGFVINHPHPNIEFSDLIDQLMALPLESSPPQPLSHWGADNVLVMNGGPVEEGRGFLLHGNDYQTKDTIILNDQLRLSNTVESLKAIAFGKGPADKIFLLGNSGWGTGQLENELRGNCWIVLDYHYDLIFNTAPNEIWEKCLLHNGITPSFLYADMGTA
jgi:putative transcriptional regulator